MSDEERDLVVVDVVGEFGDDPTVDSDRLVFQQPGFRSHNRRLVVGAGFFEDTEVHEA